MSIKVVIADDHAVVRQGLNSLLSDNKALDVQILGEAEDGNAAVALVDKVNPDILIMDISMPGLNGIDATETISRHHPGVKVIGLSMHKRLNYVLKMFNAGACGYILKESAFEDIIEAIEKVSKGEYYLSSKLNLSVPDILKNLKDLSDSSHATNQLTSRERQVLQLIAEGKETRQIANILSRSVKTVESHRKNLMDKLDIHNVADLTRYAIQEGLISLD